VRLRRGQARRLNITQARLSNAVQAYCTQNRRPVGLTPLESTSNELIVIPMKRYILRAFTRLALVWTLRRPVTMIFRSFLTLRNSQSRQIEPYLSNLRCVLRGRSAMGKTRKLLCNKTLMVKGVGFEYCMGPVRLCWVRLALWQVSHQSEVEMTVRGGASDPPTTMIRASLCMAMGLLRSGLLLQRMGWILYSKFGTVMTSKNMSFTGHRMVREA
jgi:hypothetical protein